MKKIESCYYNKMYNIFLEKIKTGDLSQVISLYQQYKNNTSNHNIEKILLPKLTREATIDEIKNTPYGYAVCHNYVDICDWLFKTFPNVEYNMDNIMQYDLIDEVCELGYLEMLKWLHYNCKILFVADYHIDSYIIALTNHHFELADYLCIMFNTDYILKDTLGIIIQRMMENPDKDILFYLFDKFKQDNRTLVDFILLLTPGISMNDSQYRKLVSNLCRY